MALTSPRFIASRHLRNVAANQATLSKGARGRSVHLVQQALLDLGYRLPRSTGSAAYSPDGIFGDETLARLKEFQARSGLKDDGVLGWRTLEALARRLPGYQHRVRLHFRSIALPRISFERSLLDAQVIFGQYGIKVEYGSGESLLLTPAQMRLFDRIDNDCEWTLSTGEYNELHNLGTRAPNDEILVYQVKELKGVLGCGGHAVNRPAVTVAGHASRWDTAHEVGHCPAGFRLLAGARQRSAQPDASHRRDLLDDSGPNRQAGPADAPQRVLQGTLRPRPTRHEGRPRRQTSQIEQWRCLC